MTGQRADINTQSNYGMSEMLMAQMQRQDQFHNMQAMLNSLAFQQSPVNKPVMKRKNNLELFNNKFHHPSQNNKAFRIKEEYINLDSDDASLKSKNHDDQDDKQSQATQESVDYKFAIKSRNGRQKPIIHEETIPNILTQATMELVEPALVEFTTTFPEWDLASIFCYLNHGNGKAILEYQKERRSLREKKVKSRQINSLKKKQASGATKTKQTKVKAN